MGMFGGSTPKYTAPAAPPPAAAPATMANAQVQGAGTAAAQRAAAAGALNNTVATSSQGENNENRASLTLLSGTR